jgi:hypothetical protein
MKTLRFVVSLLVVALVSGCGMLNNEDLVGTYSVSGTGTMAFDGLHAMTSQLDGAVTISEGVTSEFILTDPGTPNCIIPLNMQDGVARVTVGATCSMLMDDGVRITMTFTSGTATLNGQIIQLTYSGTVNAVYDGDTYPGTFTTTATLTRVGK